MATGQGKMVALEVKGRAATITLSRPPANAINDDLLKELDSALEQVPASVAVVLVRSAQKMFCAGADLKMIDARVQDKAGHEAMRATLQHFHTVYDRLGSLPAVTIAEIGGAALGGGLELALACDLRIAAFDIQLGLPEVKVGLLPGAGGTQRLTELCGPGVAARLILTGEIISGREALGLGLVQWGCAQPDLEQTSRTIVERTGALSLPALKQAKSCIGLARFASPKGFAEEINSLITLLGTGEAQTRLAEFAGRAGDQSKRQS